MELTYAMLWLQWQNTKTTHTTRQSQLQQTLSAPIANYMHAPEMPLHIADAQLPFHGQRDNTMPGQEIP